MLSTLTRRVKEQMNLELRFTDQAVAAIADAGFDPVYGARPLRRAIQSKIEDALSEKILEGTIKAGENIVCTAENGDFRFSPQ